MNNSYVDFVPSRQAAPGVPDPIAPPENNAQMTLWDYIALTATGAFGAKIGSSIVKLTVKYAKGM
jgi:hypothetical protein